MTEGLQQDDVAVRISRLHKRFGGVQAVRGLDLEIRRGEIFGLLGPNGAGGINAKGGRLCEKSCRRST